MSQMKKYRNKAEKNALGNANPSVSCDFEA